MNIIILVLSLLAASEPVFGQNPSQSPKSFLFGSQSCDEMESWDVDFAMCMPRAMPDMEMSMAMIHGNFFLVGISGEGPRGKNSFAAPNMFMGDIGKTLGSHHYLNLDLMLTLERWTFPYSGYPELLQVGEENNEDQPFIDAQHPHSSPIMGLTLSDYFYFDGTRNYIKAFIAPRGASTDGPIAFMHRPTGVVNPDAPLGHHVGQDVGHISSTLAGIGLQWKNARVEASSFNGKEPRPDDVNLDVTLPNSYSTRIAYEFSHCWLAMASYAFVDAPEEGASSLERYSASIYNQWDLMDGWTFWNAAIYGAIKGSNPLLNSWADEFLFERQKLSFWGRVELLQRTPGELQIVTDSDPLQGQWVSALTLGASHQIAQLDWGALNAGVSITKDFLPDDFRSAYGGEPLSGKVFLRLQGHSMFMN